MNVGDAAQRSGLPAKTIRYYEEIGLIAPARAANGYRDYSGDDIHRLAFLRRARNLGFSIDDCRQLMALYQDRDRASADVREIAAAHVTAIEEKVRELQSMRSTLQKLIHACGGYRADMAIGSVSAIKARHHAGFVPDATHLAAELICGASVQEAVVLADEAAQRAPADTQVPAYIQWRRHVRSQFGEHAVARG